MLKQDWLPLLLMPKRKDLHLAWSVNLLQLKVKQLSLLQLNLMHRKQDQLRMPHLSAWLLQKQVLDAQEKLLQEVGIVGSMMGNQKCRYVSAPVRI